MRLLHLLPAVLIISAVTAALKVEDSGRFGREFARTSGSLLGGFVALAAAILVLGQFL